MIEQQSPVQRHQANPGSIGIGQRHHSSQESRILVSSLHSSLFFAQTRLMRVCVGVSCKPYRTSEYRTFRPADPSGGSLRRVLLHTSVFTHYQAILTTYVHAGTSAPGLPPTDITARLALLIILPSTSTHSLSSIHACSFRYTSLSMPFVIPRTRSPGVGRPVNGSESNFLGSKVVRISPYVLLVHGVDVLASLFSTAQLSLLYQYKPSHSS